MKHVAFLFLAALTWCAPADARHRKGATPNPKLCELKTAFVKGNSESASLLRQQIEKRTWLRLSASADKVLLSHLAEDAGCAGK